MLPETEFARRIFRGAAIYGVIVMVPMYALPPPTQPALYYGFVGIVLVFQWLFWIIGGNPSKYRALMLPSVAEKLVFAVPALVLLAMRRVEPVFALFATIDLLLGIGFLVARRRTPA